MADRETATCRTSLVALVPSKLYLASTMVDRNAKRTSRELTGLPPLSAPHIATGTDDDHRRARGSKRETIAIARLLAHDAPRLAGLFGLGPLVWCAVDIERSIVSGRPEQGDVDLIIGEFQFDVHESEWDDLVSAKLREYGGDLPIGAAMLYCQMNAFELGRVCWPPDFTRAVALEVKVSRAEVAEGRIAWRSKHDGPAATRRIAGQLRALERLNFPRAGLLHIGALAPFTRTSGFWGMMEAHEMGAKALSSMPSILNTPNAESELGRFAHLQALMTSVPEFTENEVGVGPSLRMVAPGAELRGNSWATKFWSSIESLGKPLSAPAYIFHEPATGDLVLRYAPPGTHS